MGQLLPAMTQQKLDTQRDVVKNERRWSVDNQPYGTGGRNSRSSAFRRAIRSTIRSSDRWRISPPRVWTTSPSFFATYYTPDNAVLSIAGDVDLADGAADGRAVLRRDPARHRASAAARRWTCRRASSRRGAKSCRTTSGFRGCISPSGRRCSAAPSTTSPACAGRCSACGAAAACTRRWSGSARSRRMPPRSRVISPRAATSWWPMSPRGPAVSAERSRKKSLRVVDQFQRQRRHRWRKSARAVALIETAYTAALQSAADRADKLSQFATYFGDPGLMNDQCQRYRAVTADAGHCVRARVAGTGQSGQPPVRAARARRDRDGTACGRCRAACALARRHAT